MAATDQFYRNQKTLDMVFGVSCVLMLLSLFVMIYQDQKKEWKDDQRLANDVEEAMAQRDLVKALPDSEQIKAAVKAVKAAQEALDEPERKKELKKLEGALEEALATKVRAEADYFAVKADYDSKMSLLAIATEHRNAAAEAQRAPYEKEVADITKEVASLKTRMDQELDKFQKAEKAYDDVKRNLDKLKEDLTKAVTNLKKLHTEFDRIAKVAAQKRWHWRHTLRNLPVVDAFNAPVRIHQFTLDELPIEYGSFKYVTRYDRCMSCHIAIDRPAYTREALKALREAPSDLEQRLNNAKQLIADRYELIQDKKEKELLDIDLGDLRTIPHLQDKHINEFCAHPRLDLFVADNSPHPKEKFGCTICHQGQGSATAFNLAAHTPNDATTMGNWAKEYHWESQHYWDFPMLPKRFVESSCVKCHHQITDLVRNGSKEEAPKLLRGFNLVKDNGCFGCHEISGVKSGRVVGPDLRLEPWPPLDNLTPAERVKATSDPLNPAGTMRKVGPSLRRLSEKTHEEWLRKWIHNPRGFRPDTKMPHFYGLANNNEEALKGTGQEGFPNAEIHAVAHYLMQASKDYLEDGGKGEKDTYRKHLLAARAKAQEEEKATTSPTEKAKKTQEVAEIQRRLDLYKVPSALDDKRITLESGATVELPPAGKDDPARGRVLFTERGCLACHSHKGTETAGQNLPPVTGDAQFGPKLGQMAAKLGTKPGDRASARRWLVQWILNPNQHHPRTFMPVTHLTVDQAADVAAWILSQEPTWEAKDVDAPDLEKNLKALARVWLEKSRTFVEIDDLLENKNATWLQNVRPDSDEALLKGGPTLENLKMYVGKRAVNYMGCYACHDIPGFESAKPIGTALNDWGKKDGERLAFEDISAYIKKHYQTVKSQADDKDMHDHAIHYDQGKAPYEEFYLDQIGHHTRIGFLHQKLREPRSYDHDRKRKWDERLRMPQFKFGRVDRLPKESNEEYAKRSEMAEAEAREAVMTFILGLVAEPIPAKYVYNPAPDRLAEVKGRQVLDKYNCAGCHIVRPGVFELKKTPEVIDYLDRFAGDLDALAKKEITFTDHSAWVGRPQPHADRLVAHGLFTKIPRDPQDDPEAPERSRLQLTEALRFTNAQNQTRDIFAGERLLVGSEDRRTLPETALLSRSEPYGGKFARLMTPYLMQKDPTNYGRIGRDDDAKALSALPPALLRQGERTQPDWLFRFLRNPHPIRPTTVLRMPKFNMSEEEAIALVNYFAGADKTNNPAEGLVYPYAPVPQRDDAYWQKKTREYVARLESQPGELSKRLSALKPLWEQQLKDEHAQFDKKIAVAEAAAKVAEGDAKKQLEQTVNALKEERKKVTLEALEREWKENYAYASDAYRMLTNYNNICLSCHRVGNVPAQQEQGPPLDLAWERLRPQWTEKWLANPPRMISHYVPVMPRNFDNANVDANHFHKAFADFLGTPRQQATAASDLLLNLQKMAELPVNRLHTPTPAGQGKPAEGKTEAGKTGERKK